MSRTFCLPNFFFTFLIEIIESPGKTGDYFRDHPKLSVYLAIPEFNFAVKLKSLPNYKRSYEAQADFINLTTAAIMKFERAEKVGLLNEIESDLRDIYGQDVGGVEGKVETAA